MNDEKDIQLGPIFAQMEQVKPGAGHIQRRISVTENAEAVVYLNTESGLRGVRLEFAHQLASVDALETVRGLKITLSQSGLGQHIAIEQARPGDGQLFSSVIESILNAFGEFPKREANAAADKLVRWRAFFSRHSEGLSREEQLGLFAELVVLRKLAKRAGGPSAAVAFWEGPHSEVHDFSQDEWAIEVKATASLGSGVATINNERQLDPSSVEALTLVFFAFDVRPSGAGTTLPQLVTRVRKELSAFPASSDHFEDLLIEAGYSDTHAPQYHSHYTALRQDAFRVDDEFPSIREAQLPDAVSRVRYSLNVDMCVSWQVDLEATLDALGGEPNAA